MPTITTVDATWDTGVAMDAAELRRADTALFLGDGTANGVRGGIVRHGDTSLAVSVNGSDQVTVQAGAVVIPAATGLGVYRAALSAATAAVGIDARNGTNPRIDLVVFRATGTSTVVETVTGTPAVTPSVPALPASSVELARLSVPAVGGGAVTVDSTFRTFATSLGGTLFVPTAARLPGSGNLPGQRAVALDTGREHVWNGTAWVLLNTPGGTLGYAQVTANQTGISTETNLTGLSVSVTVGSARRIRVSCQILSNRTVVDGIMRLRLKEGLTVHHFFDANPNVANNNVTQNGSVILTPTAGAHTYHLSLARETGTGTVDMIAGPPFPAFILVEDIGAA